MLSRIRANRKIRLSAVVSSHASRANANAFGNEGFRVGTSIDTYHYRSSINRNKIRARNRIFCILGTYIFIFVKDEGLSSDNYAGKNARIFQSRDLYVTLY